MLVVAYILVFLVMS